MQFLLGLLIQSGANDIWRLDFSGCVGFFDLVVTVYLLSPMIPFVNPETLLMSRLTTAIQERV